VKVVMSQREKWCLEHAERFKGKWELSCVSKDAWLAGYRKALEECKAALPEESDIIEAIGSASTEVEFADGAHQLRQTS
jgi:hypothetical protein